MMAGRFPFPHLLLMLVISHSRRIVGWSPSVNQVLSLKPLVTFIYSRRAHSSDHPTTLMSFSPNTPSPSDPPASSTTVILTPCPTITLRNGQVHPSIGFGTYKVGFIPPSASSAVASVSTSSSATPPTERTARECVLDALAVGYRCLECAEFYGNEQEVGKAIAESGIPRNELFLCSKVWTTTIEKGPHAIRQQLDRTLTQLGTEYLDLYLIHWPVPKHHVTAYQTLIELRNSGKIRGIGVSNYVWEDYLELKETIDDPADLPLVNQIEINPFLYRQKTIEKFTKERVVMQSYRSLRDGKAFDHPVLREMAAKYGRTPAQILGRWCVQHGFVYIPKSIRKERMIENAAVFDFELEKDDMNTLDHLTTPETLTAFEQLYRKCVNRDTSKEGTMEGVKMQVTVD